MPVLLLAAVLTSTAVVQRRPVAADRIDSFIRQTLNVTDYKRADVDLNRDGKKEALVYGTGPAHCGTGGCTFYVLTPAGRSYRTLMRSTVAQLPIRMLLTSSHGWRDIGITVSGGGVTRPYLARLRFNGRRYPSNPSLQPALRRSQQGSVLID